MGKLRFDLGPDERIVLKATCIRHGFWGAFTNELYLTNHAIVLVNLGLLGNFKGFERYPLETIQQAIMGEAQNGEDQLEIYHDNDCDDFAFQTDDTRELRLWVMAINDQLKGDNEMYDYNYYQNFSESTLEEMVEEQEQEYEDSSNRTEFLGDVAKHVIKSKNFSPAGIAKGVVKAQLKQSASSGIGKDIKDGLGITELQDEFTEIGNEFREMVGLKPKLTQRAIREKKMDRAFNQQMDKVRNKAQVQKTNSVSQELSVDEQIEALKKLKDLLDAGILTKDEFDAKKKEIMGL